LDPKDAISYTERGVAHVLRREHDLAIADQEKAVELAPSYYRGTIYFNRGLAYFAAGNREKAIADIDKAIEINPKEPSYVEFRKQISP
jgi:tetratricopeptide (TPR) repeat protein